jgi:hypothetical protein
MKFAEVTGYVKEERVSDHYGMLVIYSKEYRKTQPVAFYGEMEEVTNVEVVLYPDKITGVRIYRHGRPLVESKPVKYYKSEAVAYNAVKVSLEYHGLQI